MGMAYRLIFCRRMSNIVCGDRTGVLTDNKESSVLLRLRMRCIHPRRRMPAFIFS